MLQSLPSEVRTLARENYVLWRQDPTAPGLFFKPLRGQNKLWSARVGLGHRAVCSRRGDVHLWFWVGTKGEFDSLFGKGKKKYKGP